MGKTIAFGAGCFAFEWRKPVGSRDAHEWAKDVERALNALVNVSNIVCDVPSAALAYGEVDGDLGIAPTAYPQPEWAFIQFVIHIPRRHQSLDPGELGVGENFRVTVEYGYDGPVATVRPLDTLAPGSASISVMVVWKYLAEQVADEEVKFSMVGPSPFHADFALREGSPSQNQPIRCEIIESHGYDQINFSYDPQAFEDEKHAHSTLRNEITRELSLYYSLIRAANSRMRKASEIEGMTEKLIALHTQSGRRAKLKRLFRSGSHARDLSLAVMDAEFVAASDKEHAEEAVRVAYRGEGGFLRRYIEPLANPRVSSLVTNGKNVVQQLESSRTKEMEIVLLAGSTVTGALSGAVVSAMLNR